MTHFACKTNPTNPSFKDIYAATPTPSVPGAHNFVSQWGASGTGPSFFKEPHYLVVGPDSNVYVSDYNNYYNGTSGLVQVFSSTGAYLRSWSVDSPQGISADNQGDIYVALQSQDAIKRFSSQGTAKSTDNVTSMPCTWVSMSAEPPPQPVTHVYSWVFKGRRAWRWMARLTGILPAPSGRRAMRRN